MKTPENDKWLDDALTDAIGSEEMRTDFRHWKKRHPQAVQMLTSRAESKSSTIGRPYIVRIKIMQNPVARLAAAAAVIVVVLIGVSRLGGSATSVAWGEVAKKVESSPGIILRCREFNSNEPDGAGYLTIYNCPTRSRVDRHEEGRITLSIYQDLDALTVVYVAHDRKAYLRETMSDKTAQEHRDWTDPRYFVRRLQSCKYRKLGPRTVEGVRCEGLETTDPAFSPANFPVVSLVAQIWVSVETGYPVLMEIEAVGGDDGKLRIGSVCDQFEWDVELDTSEFEPKIPPDYEQM